MCHFPSSERIFRRNQNQKVVAYNGMIYLKIFYIGQCPNEFVIS